METKNYKSYVKGVISQANREKAAYDRDLVYHELCKYLRSHEMKLENEMFKAVLKCCSELTKHYIQTHSEITKEEIFSTASLYSMCFHTFTGEDDVHTNVNILQGYVEEVMPHILQRVETESEWGDSSLRIRKVDIARLGKLFDEILEEINDPDLKILIEEKMNSFCLDLTK